MSSLRLLFTEIVFSVTQLAAIDWNGDIMRYLGQKMTTSNPRHYILTFRRSSEVTALGRPYSGQNGVLGFLEVLRPRMWLIFHIELLIWTLYHFRCQSGSLSQFALGVICPVRMTLYPSGGYTLPKFDQDAEQTCNSVQN